MKSILLILVSLTLFAFAGDAVYYLAEGFEGSFPPEGWTWRSYTQGGYASWTQWSGPWGYDVYGSITSGYASIFTSLFSCPITIPENITIFFRFDYKRTQTEYYEHAATFAIGTNTNPLQGPYIYYQSLDTIGQWTTVSGEAITTLGTTYRTRWWITTTTGNTSLQIDNVYISDEPFISVEPASLGSIKSAFR
jgi:hypothetical protein